MSSPPTSLDDPLLLTPEEYRRELGRYQVALREVCHQLYLRKRTVVVVFEGWDASGKGGCIRRITDKIDPRGVEVFPIAAPVGDERTHHYLWRFWRRIRPATDKQVLIFDRSWYGRVLVERVEGFCTEPEWMRAYDEINDFERQLADGGVIVKFWLDVTPEEQLRRFHRRSNVPHKRWKLTDEDWRNREKRAAYEIARDEMLRKTSTAAAPWYVIDGDDKLYARVRTLRILVDTLASDLELAVVDEDKRLRLQAA